ncbi:MAG: hypothetical protein FWF79_06770 [Defluviitaleaceae bacterium]|nr:hypothetical protein [Defluviitaleaceae bacterium]
MITDKKILTAFCLFNIAVFIVASVILVPVIGALRRELTNINLLERQYFTQQNLLDEYRENRAELAELTQARRALVQDEIIPYLAKISRRGDAFGLDITEFTASEPAGSFIAGDEIRIYDKRVSAEFIGEFRDALYFLRELGTGFGEILSFSVDYGARARLRLELSLRFLQN